MSVKNNNQLAHVFRDFLQSYFEKDTGISDQEWLKGKLQEAGIDLNEEALEKYTADLVGSVESFSESLRSLEKSKAEGKTADEWLQEKIKESGREVPAEEIQQVNAALLQANQRVVRNLKAEEVGQTVNTSVADITVEQKLIDDFNEKAVADGDRYEAVVDKPEEGSVYGRNLFDVVIRDKITGEKLESYQVIYGTDLQETIELVDNATSAGQIIVVPEGMVEAVQDACPFKDIADHIGGTGRVAVESTALSLSETEVLFQEEPKPFISKLLADPEESVKEFADTAFSTGVLTAGFTEGFERLAGSQEVEEFNASDILERTLLSKDNDGLKTVAAGALATAVHRGLVTALPKNVPPVVVANIASVGVENVKVLSQVAEGTITVDEGLEHMGNMNVAMGFEFVWNKYAVPGASMFLRAIPIVGPFISNTVVAGEILKFVKTPIKELVVEGVKKIVPAVKSVAKNIYNTAKNVVNSIKEALFSWW